MAHTLMHNEKLTQKLRKLKKIYLLHTKKDNSESFKEKSIYVNELSQDILKELQNNSNCMLVVGMDVPDDILKNRGLHEFDNYVYEKYVNKYITIIYGNCHTTIISQILSQCKTFDKNHIIYPIQPIHTINDPDYFNLPVFKYCDIFIHQSIRKENRYGEEYSSERVISHLNQQCKIIGIPNVYHLPICFFPQYSEGIELKSRHGHSVFFRDSILDESIALNFPLKKP